MSRKLAVLVLSLLAVGAAMVAPAKADDAILKTHLTGAAEAPGPGDPDGVGDAKVYIDDDTNHLCLQMTWANVDGTYSGLHIHFAPPGSPGPVVVPFTVPPTPSNSTFQCVTVADEALLDNISVNPQQYYLNLHSTPTYPAGAIRGQLSK